MTSKRHVIVDGRGIPLGLHLESASVHELRAAVPVLQSIRVPRRRGRPRSRPGGLAADRGYDSIAFRSYLASRGIRHSIPMRRGAVRRFQTHRELSDHRWKVERFFAWLNGFRRLGIRFERHSLIYHAFLILAAIMITFRYF
jgi:transposase